MLYVLIIVGIVVLVGRLIPRVAAWKQSSAAERSFAIRFTAFTWLLGVIFVLALIFLPNKGRVLMMVPIFLIGTSLAKWWQSSRARLRREAQGETNFARARRIN